MARVRDKEIAMVMATSMARVRIKEVVSYDHNNRGSLGSHLHQTVWCWRLHLWLPSPRFMGNHTACILQMAYAVSIFG